MIVLVLALLAYVVGATPTAWWVGRALFGVDLRRRGSGNLGATNALRVLGWKAGLAVLFVDTLKGFLPAMLFPLVLGVSDPGWGAVFGAAAIAGHAFPFWTAFRGGKGVATSAGVLLALAPVALALAFAVWLGAVALTRYVSVGSILAALVLPVAVLVTARPGDEAVLWLAAALAVFVLWSHRSNLTRLRRGEEARLGIRDAAEEGR